MPLHNGRLPASVCVTGNPALRRTLLTTLGSSGSSVKFVDELSSESTANASLVFIDHDSRRAVSIDDLIQIVGNGRKLIILGDSLRDNELMAMLRDSPVDHVISDTIAPDENELVVTSCKLLSGDIFGLEKYLSWGAQLHQQRISTYEDKRGSLFAVTKYARSIGARRHVLAKIETVCDELLMNAMYDAPSSRGGAEPSARVAMSTADTKRAIEKEALVRYGCDGRHFGVSVQDNYGELEKATILSHILRARREGGRPNMDRQSCAGAGLGLYFILASVTRFIANLEPGKRTEIVCLFDLRQKARDAADCAQSLHIFTRRPEANEC